MSLAAAQALIAALDWPAGLVVRAAPAREALHALFPVERAALARARQARRADFCAGRRAARAALIALGHRPAAIPQGEDRAPIWPDGVAGSITHAGGAAIAVLGEAAAWDGIGIDFERDRPLDVETARVVRRPGEPDDPIAVFGAKEALFKAQFPRTRAMLAFGAAQVAGDLASARLCDGDPLPPAWRGRRLPIAQTRGHGFVLTLCAVPGAGVPAMAGPRAEATSLMARAASGP